MVQVAGGAPGVKVQERVGAPRVVAVGTTTGLAVGISERGPVDKGVVLGSFGEFQDRYGSFFSGSFLAHAVRAFFNEGGTRLFVIRVVETGVAATLNTGVVVSDNAITWTAAFTGILGNSISVTLTDPAGPTVPLSVSVVGFAIDVTLETDGGSAIISTAAQVISLITADADASELVTVANTGTSDGTGTMVAEVLANLAGGLGANAAFDKLVDIEETNNTLRIDARDVGAFGNSLFIRTIRTSTTSAEDLVTAATTLLLTSITGFQIGDVLKIDDGSDDAELTIQAINVATRTITFNAVTLGATVLSGATVRTGSNHRVSTKLEETLNSNATSAKLQTNNGLRKGQRFYISNGTVEVNVLVTSVNGDTIFFADIGTLTGPIAAGSPAVSQEFELAVLEGGELAENVFQFLSMEDTNEQDFVENRLSGEGNESLLIVVTDLDSVTSDATHHLPVPIADKALANGQDGGTPQDADFIGSSVPGSESGMQLIRGEDLSNDINFFAVPGITTVAVDKEAESICEDLKDIDYIGEPPQQDNLPDEAIDYVINQVNSNSRHMVYYYPWLQITDPVTSNKIFIPPSGHMMGEWADVANSDGLQFAPANRNLRGVEDVEFRVSETQHGDLNDNHINAILFERGLGIRPQGSRTQEKSILEGNQFIVVSRIFNFTLRALEEGLKGFRQLPASRRFVDQLGDAAVAFLLDMHRSGLLTPADDPTQAFFAKFGEDVNPQSQLDLGIVALEVGIHPPRSIEFIIVRVGLFDGGVDIQTIVP